MYILGEGLQALPIGVAGELHIGGEGLARGYLHNPELTAQKFIPHPFQPGERLYRTGDLARWLPDGNIEFLGRIDHQLKIRGYRIEAGEVEQALLAHPAIQSAVVVGHDFEHGKELVAYLAPASGQSIPDVSALRSFLSESLPDYMIPSHFVELEAMPLTTSGKVDRKALPAPEVSGLATGTAYVAPRNAVEKQLVQIWSEVLGRDDIGIYDNFFHLGGHSLRAIQLAARISQAFGIQFPMAAIFKHPTSADMADKLRRLSPDMLPAGILLTSGAEPTLFTFPPALGLGIFFQSWAYLLDDFPVYAFDFLPEADRLEKYYREIKAHQPQGPYHLMGYSAGGNLAYEVARYLETKGEKVNRLLLLDSGVRSGEHRQTEEEIKAAAQSLADYIDGSPHLTVLQELLRDEPSRRQVMERMLAFYRYMNEYTTEGKIAADIMLLQSGDPTNGTDARRQWAAFTTGSFKAYQGEGEHIAMFQPPHLEGNAAILGRMLQGDATRRETDESGNNGEWNSNPFGLPFEVEGVVLSALGQLVTEHFERGGEPGDFSPDRYREDFPEAVEAVEAWWRRTVPETPPAPEQIGQLWEQSRALYAQLLKLQQEAASL